MDIFTKADFSEYIKNKKDHYDGLVSFIIDPNHVSPTITIDADFMNRMDTHFSQFLQRRLEATKFTYIENKEYKALFLKIFPETTAIFEYRGPCVYWFKIRTGSGITNEKIVQHFSSIRGNGTGWWTRADQARSQSTTDILYLGKIETALQNRFIGHVGLGHDYTSSLKLQRWLTGVEGLTLDFQFLKLDGKWKHYTEDIEKVMWEVAQPLLGAKPRI